MRDAWFQVTITTLTINLLNFLNGIIQLLFLGTHCLLSLLGISRTEHEVGQPTVYIESGQTAW